MLLFLLLQMGFSPMNPTLGQVTYAPGANRGFALQNTLYSNLSSTAAQLNLTTSFSVGGWFRADLLGSNGGVLTASSPWTSQSAGTGDVFIGYMLHTVGNGDQVGMQACDTINGCTTSSRGIKHISAGEIHHFVGTYDSTTRVATLYIDGVAGSTHTLANALRNTTNNVFVGSYNTGTSWLGAIDTLWYANTVFTPDMITYVFNQGKGAKCNESFQAAWLANIVACWDLEEASGTRVESGVGTCGAVCDLTPGTTNAGALPSNSPGLIKSLTNVMVP